MVGYFLSELWHCERPLVFVTGITFPKLNQCDNLQKLTRSRPAHSHKIDTSQSRKQDGVKIAPTKYNSTKVWSKSMKASPCGEAPYNQRMPGNRRVHASGSDGHSQYLLLFKYTEYFIVRGHAGLLIDEPKHIPDRLV